ncbi:hypothetical protein AQJ43_29735 [Streptomyces avermitilis]|nr:hypothetical protein AQJ43_29735 [Streptomyces avermitilis]
MIERATDLSLGHVRLHTGPAVRTAARAAGVAGFTLGPDIAVATGPGEGAPDRLLRHELMHAAQQTMTRRGGAAGTAPTELRAAAEEQAARAAERPERAEPPVAVGPHVAAAAEGWLNSTADVRNYGMTQLLDELNAVNEWLDRQTTSTPEDDTMLAAKAAIEAELARKNRAMAAPDRTRRGRRPRGAAPAAEELPQQVPMPRVLAERTSTVPADAVEARTEVDRITAWLQRPDLSRQDRALLRQELKELAPHLAADLARASGERRQARLTEAFTPVAEQSSGLVDNLRTIEGIRPSVEQPGMAYVIHRDEMLLFPQELADQVREQTVAALADAARGIRTMNAATDERMRHHLHLNYEEQPYVGFAGSVVGGEEPYEVQDRVRDPWLEAVAALRDFDKARRQGALVAMGEAVLAATAQAEQARAVVNAGVGKAEAAAGDIADALTTVRNLSYTVALAAGAIIAAPLAASAVAGMGATGLTATALTTAGTAGMVGAGGAGLGFVGGAGGEAVSGGSARQVLRAGLEEGQRVGIEGLQTGAGAGAATGFARNLGLHAVRMSRAQTMVRSAVAQGGGNVVGGLTGAALNAPPEGMTRAEAALRGVLPNLGLGALGGFAGGYSQGLSSPAMRRLVGVGLPAAAEGGVEYLRTGDAEHAFTTAARSAAIGSLLHERAGLGAGAERRAFEFGHGVRTRAGNIGRGIAARVRPLALGLSLGLSQVRALRMAGTGGTAPVVELGVPGARSSLQDVPTTQGADVVLAGDFAGPSAEQKAQPGAPSATVAEPTAQPGAPSSAAAEQPSAPGQTASTLGLDAARFAAPEMAKDLATLKNSYLRAIADLDAVRAQARTLGLSERETNAFLRMWGECPTPMTAEEVGQEMGAWSTLRKQSLPSAVSSAEETLPVTLKASVLPHYSSKSAFMEAMRRRLLAQRASGKESLLDFLLDADGQWQKGSFIARSGRPMRGRYALSDPDRQIVQAGHMLSDWYVKAMSRRDHLMLEDADLNWMSGFTEASGSVTSKSAVLIEGYPVDIPTARLWEAHGKLPAGTVSAAPVVEPPAF